MNLDTWNEDWTEHLIFPCLPCTLLNELLSPKIVSESPDWAAHMTVQVATWDPIKANFPLKCQLRDSSSVKIEDSPHSFFYVFRILNDGMSQLQRKL